MRARLPVALARGVAVLGVAAALTGGCGDLPVQPLSDARDCPQPAFRPCSDECVHILSNDQHCGGCGIPCKDAEHCAAGLCQPD